MEQELSFMLNQKPVHIVCDLSKRLLDVLRDDLHMTGTKEGCAIGECGACTVVVDSYAVASCLTLAGQVEGKHVQTVEGLSQDQIGALLQRCFVEGGAVQCGFCTPGMLMSAYALLTRNPDASREEIKLALSGNLCRCTGYVPIVNAVEKAKEELKKL